MSNGRGTRDKDKKAGPAGKLGKTIQFNPKPIDIGRLKKLTADNELDSYNKFVEKIADSLELGPSGLGKRPPKILFERTTPPIPPRPGAPERFRKNRKKPVFKTGTKEKVKGLEQNMADGGQVFDMTTEMVIDE